MRCLACGHEMEVTQSEPHESLSDLEYYSFKCTHCGDTERRLLSRQRVAAAEIAASMKAAMTSSLPKPQEKIGRKEDHSLGRGFSNLRDKSPTAQRHWNRLNELFKDPKKFIDRFVRNREQKSPDEKTDF